MFVDTETHPYIDLTQLQFPYSLDEIFDEQDFQPRFREFHVQVP